MAILYVVEQGAYLSKRGDRVEISKNRVVLESVPAFALEQVVCFGNVGVSAPVRNFLLDQQIDTVFMTSSGRFRGRLNSYSGDNIELRQHQFRQSQSEAFLVDLAQRFVEGKLRNSRALLRRQQRRVQSDEIGRALIRIRGTLSRLDSAETLDQVRGHEGDGSASYFGCLSCAIKPDAFKFRRRTRRPPKDPFNSLLSFGYTMLLGTVMTAVQVVGLDPYLGALHAPRNGKPSIALDLMEEFRPILVDALALRAVNKRQITANDFQYHPEAEAAPEPEDGKAIELQNYPVLMGRSTIKKWLAIYDSTLKSRVDYPRYGCQLSYQQIITEQARLLARHFKEEEPYRSFAVR